MLLFESLNYEDMVGLLKPTVHIDEFSSKMGDDDEIVVVSFFVRDSQAAKDLVKFFEKGYDFILDASRSPGEIKPGRFLVYVELRRRSTTGERINEILSDLETLTEFNAKDWKMTYQDKEQDWSVEAFNSLVPRSPRQYRQEFELEDELNEMRSAAGLNIKTKPITDPELKNLQALAGR